MAVRSSRVLGMGVDVVNVARVGAVFQRFEGRFLRRAYHPEEIQDFQRLGRVRRCEEENTTKISNEQLYFLASRWAVKEACHKALSCWRLPFPDLRYEYSRSDRKSSILPGAQEVASAITSHRLYRPTDRPRVAFYGEALEVAQLLKISNTHVSISHDGEYAFASVLMECQDGA